MIGKKIIHDLVCCLLIEKKVTLEKARFSPHFKSEWVDHFIGHI